MIYACEDCLNALAVEEVEEPLMVNQPIAGLGSSGATAHTYPIMAAWPEPICRNPEHGPYGYVMRRMSEEEYARLEGK